MYKKLLILLLFTQCTQLNAQKKEARLRKMNAHFSAREYSLVIPLLRELLATDSLDPDLNYKAGVCYLNSRSQKQKAVRFFEKAMTNSYNSQLPVNAAELLGDAYFMNGEYEKAGIAYLKAKKPNSPTDSSLLNWKIGMCGHCMNASSQNATVHLSLTKEPSIEICYRYSPGKGDDPFFGDFYQPLATENKLVPASEQEMDMEATIGTSMNAQNILIYRNVNGSCQLYTSQLIYNTWSVPQKINSQLNTAGWEEGEFISADNTQMYFTSDRPGGYGGKDIYKCERLPSGDWSKAINLGPTINTAFDEEAPFIHPNKNVLYFSSGRYTANKGYDIFCSYREQNGWSWPVKMGYPVKTDQESIAADYAADGEGKALLNFQDEKGNVLSVLSGKAEASGRELSALSISIITSHWNRCEFFTKERFSILLPQADKITATFKANGFVYRTEIVDLKRNHLHPESEFVRRFEPVETGRITRLENIEFEPGKKNLNQASESELEILAEFLQSNSQIAVELSGYIDSPENKRYNSKLSQERIAELIGYLVSKGIEKERLIAKNYGKSIIKKENRFEKEKPLNGEQQLEMKIVQQALLSTQ